MMLLKDEDGKVVSGALMLEGRVMVLHAYPLQYSRDPVYTRPVHTCTKLTVIECSLDEFNVLRKHGFAGDYAIERFYLPVRRSATPSQRESLRDLILESHPTVIQHPEDEYTSDNEFTLMPGFVRDDDTFSVFSELVHLADLWK